MGKWLLVVLALVSMVGAAFLALPPLISDCSEARLPKLAISAIFLIPWAAAGLFVTIKGDVRQRMVLFAGTSLTLATYGYALSLILPLALGPTTCPSVS